METLLEKKILRERGEGDAIGEYESLHEENFLSSWFREDGKEEEEIIMDTGKETKEERSEKRRKTRTKRRVLKEGVSVFFLWRPLKSSVKEGDLESCGWSFFQGLFGEA